MAKKKNLSFARQGGEGGRKEGQERRVATFLPTGKIERGKRGEKPEERGGNQKKTPQLQRRGGGGGGNLGKKKRKTLLPGKKKGEKVKVLFSLSLSINQWGGESLPEGEMGKSSAFRVPRA